MDLDTFLRRRRELAAEAPRFRRHCPACRQPDFGCYCPHVRPLALRMKFVILIHPIEVRRRIATGRMSHLGLVNSELIQGQDFTRHARVEALLGDAEYRPVVLYPGPDSRDLSRAEPAPGEFDAEKPPMVFVIDGTWATARAMMRSENLRSLPRVCFTPDRPSRFRVRKQPGANCVSTIEAIHRTIELLGPATGFDPTTRAHDALLDVFDVVVEAQLKYVTHNHRYSRKCGK